MFYPIGFSNGTLKGDLRHCNKIKKNIYDPQNRGREHNRVRVRERYRKRDCDWWVDGCLLRFRFIIRNARLFIYVKSLVHVLLPKRHKIMNVWKEVLATRKRWLNGLKNWTSEKASQLHENGRPIYCLIFITSNTFIQHLRDIYKKLKVLGIEVKFKFIYPYTQNGI